MEAIWVAAEMRAGAAVAHATLALTELGVGAHPPVAKAAERARTGRQPG